MSYSFKLVTLLIVLCTVIYIESLTVIPEKAEVVFTNAKYLDHSKIYIKRYGRRSSRSQYYLDVEGNTKHTWANNVTIQFIFMEYLHNEYRRTFIELHYRLCDFITQDVYIAGKFTAAGIECPMKPNHYRLYNMSANAENFPSIFPMEKGRIETSISITETGELISKSHIDALFKK